MHCHLRSLILLSSSALIAAHKALTHHYFRKIEQCTELLMYVRGSSVMSSSEPQFLGDPTPGRLRPAPGQRPGWVMGAGGGRPLPL